MKEYSESSMYELCLHVHVSINIHRSQLHVYCELIHVFLGIDFYLINIHRSQVVQIIYGYMYYSELISS